jgi:hypothetical protein
MRSHRILFERMFSCYAATKFLMLSSYSRFSEISHNHLIFCIDLCHEIAHNLLCLCIDSLLLDYADEDSFAYTCYSSTPHTIPFFLQHLMPECTQNRLALLLVNLLRIHGQFISSLNQSSFDHTRAHSISRWLPKFIFLQRQNIIYVTQNLSTQMVNFDHSRAHSIRASLSFDHGQIWHSTSHHSSVITHLLENISPLEIGWLHFIFSYVRM